MKETIICPNCHSDQLSANQKGFNNNQAALGLLTGGVLHSMAYGMMDSGKVQITCLKCGNKFIPGAGAIKKVDDAGNESINYLTPTVENTNKRIAIVTIVICVILLILILAFFSWLSTPPTHQ